MENTKKVIITPIVQTITVGYKADPVYTFDELPEDVQRQLINDEVELRQEESVNYFPWFDEDFDSFKTTAEILNIETEWEADVYGASIYIVAENNNEYVDMCDITGLRAYKYIVNNFLPELRRGKYYSLAYNKEKHCYPYRHSKCQFNYDGDGCYLDLIPNEVWQGMKKVSSRKTYPLWTLSKLSSTNGPMKLVKTLFTTFPVKGSKKNCLSVTIIGRKTENLSTPTT